MVLVLARPLAHGRRERERERATRQGTERGRGEARDAIGERGGEEKEVIVEVEVGGGKEEGSRGIRE